MEGHKHGATANHESSFATFVGCKVAGVMRNVSNRGGVTLVFDCGWGLTVRSNGAYWVETPEEIERARKALLDAVAMAGQS